MEHLQLTALIDQMQTLIDAFRTALNRTDLANNGESALSPDAPIARGLITPAVDSFASKMLSLMQLLEARSPLSLHRIVLAAFLDLPLMSELVLITLGELQREGFIVIEPSGIGLTEKGRAAGISDKAALDLDSLEERIAVQLTRDQNTVFRLLLAKNGRPVKKREILIAIPTTSEAVASKLLRELEALGLIVRTGDSYSCAEMLYM